MFSRQDSCELQCSPPSSFNSMLTHRLGCFYDSTPQIPKSSQYRKIDKKFFETKSYFAEQQLIMVHNYLDMPMEDLIQEDLSK